MGHRNTSRAAVISAVLVTSTACSGAASSTAPTTTPVAAAATSSTYTLPDFSPPPATLPNEPTFDASPSDFTIEIKTLRKVCFGSAGCNIRFRIDPAYNGFQMLPMMGEIEVTYEVLGGEDGPQINTFVIDDQGDARFDKEEQLSTPSSRTKVTARAIDVEFNPDA